MNPSTGASQSVVRSNTSQRSKGNYDYNLKVYFCTPLDVEIRPKTYIRCYGEYRPEFVPLHPEWHPPEVVYHGRIGVWECAACNTYAVTSEPWTYFVCSNPKCRDLYHRHCINLHTRTAIEDGLLKKWVCCGSLCLQDYPLDQVYEVLRHIQKTHYIKFKSNLDRAVSVAEDIYGPETINYNFKIHKSSSVCWSKNSYSVPWSDRKKLHTADGSLEIKSRHIISKP